ncbi:MAG TPA: hypothetical protein VMZ91_14160 [Candidatus Paceibacterota bacterium]|nr:hypothetical protein [Candidatus Paceibacterota bacterium]
MLTKKNKLIQVINKKDTTIKMVSDDYKIQYAGEEHTIKELNRDDLTISGVIIVENDDLVLLYKNKRKRFWNLFKKKGEIV